MGFEIFPRKSQAQIRKEKLLVEEKKKLGAQKAYAIAAKKKKKLKEKKKQDKAERRKEGYAGFNSVVGNESQGDSASTGQSTLPPLNKAYGCQQKLNTRPGNAEGGAGAGLKNPMIGGGGLGGGKKGFR